jgi:quercetin dioxygenase-like cupin family protein
MSAPLRLPASMTVIQPAELQPVLAPPHMAVGDLWIETVLSSAREAELTALKASYAPGTRTHWHAHPRGQLLHIVSGVCLVQAEGGAVQAAEAGSFVWLAPFEVHWHGASEDAPMTYVSVQAISSGVATHWR